MKNHYLCGIFNLSYDSDLSLFLYRYEVTLVDIID